MSSRLPTELLYAILYFVYGKAQLYRLCLTSKLLRSVAEPRLYQLYFKGDVLRFKRFQDLLLHPRFGTIINSLHIIMGPQYGRCKGTSPPEGSCLCDKIDETIGNALSDLLSLEILRLGCFLCGVDSPRRHRWLLTLKTRSLRAFTFNCGCCSIEAVELLTAPFMESVTTLDSFHRADRSRRVEEQLGSLSLNRSILPNLRYLHHCGDEIYNLILRHLPITRLATPSESSNGSSRLNRQDLWNTRGRLTHMCLTFLDYEEFKEFFKAMVDDPLPFRNLQHLGTFVLISETGSVSLNTMSSSSLTRFKECCDELCHTLGQLALSKRLISLNATYLSECIPRDEYISAFERGLPKISELFPRLCRVFFEMPVQPWATDIWVLSDKWECKVRGCSIDNFDIVSGSEPPAWELKFLRHRESFDIDRYLHPHYWKDWIYVSSTD
jgi:hypothetical protein